MPLKASTALAISLLLVCSVPSRARLFHHPFHPECNPTTITQEEIRNFHQVDADLYRGAHPSCGGYAKLAALGIRTIIDLQGGSERKMNNCMAKAKPDAPPFHFIPFNINLFQTTFTGVPNKKLDRLFGLMAAAPKPIFISCKFGEDRTGVIVALYRMKRGEMPYAEARQEALYYGFATSLCGLNRTFKRYRDPRALDALPPPGTPSPPTSVCRPKQILPP